MTDHTGNGPYTRIAAGGGVITVGGVARYDNCV